jgi:hypothetical protein
MMSRGAGRIHRPIPEERIEDAGQAAGQRDDGDLLAPARGNAQGRIGTTNGIAAGAAGV